MYLDSSMAVKEYALKNRIILHQISPYTKMKGWQVRKTCSRPPTPTHPCSRKNNNNNNNDNDTATTPNSHNKHTGTNANSKTT